MVNYIRGYLMDYYGNPYVIPSNDPHKYPLSGELKYSYYSIFYYYF